MSGIKIALAYHKLAGASTRTRFVSRDCSYHGSCFGGTSVGGMAPNGNLFEPLLDVDQIRSSYSRERQTYARGEPAWGGDLADDLTASLALEDRAAIAPVIVEPMARSAGVFASPQGSLERLREITRPSSIFIATRASSSGPARSSPSGRRAGESEIGAITEKLRRILTALR